MIKSIEICNHCGKSVAVGTGCFINRIPDLNGIDTRVANGLKYPIGDFICYECDCKNSDSWELLTTLVSKLAVTFRRKSDFEIRFRKLSLK